MRPLELSMKAFGSYVEETIRFSDLKSGLYLVTGDTGAGKTTIFDAIMFAFYGRASGRDRDRNPELLHSDHVDKSVDTVVKLSFLHDDRECVITRSIHFPKKRGAEAYGDPKQEAVLEEPDRPAIRGATNVTRRCEELLGLDADQFRKIIMLAQGEFKEFLKADSDKKGEILGKLFDSAPYRWFQNLLCKARDALEDQRNDARNQLASLMNTAFRRPGDMDDEAALLYAPGHPELTANLEALITREAGAVEAIKAKLEAEKQEIDRLNTQKGAAERVNQDLDNLEKAVERQRALDAAQAEYKRRRAVMELAEKALHKALPAVTAYEQAEKSWQESREKLERLEGEIKQQAQDCEKAKKAVEDDRPAEEQVAKLNAEIGRTDEQKPLYDELEQAVKDHRQVDREAGDARNAEEAAKREKQRLETEIESVTQNLEALKDVDVRLAQAQARYDAACERVEALAGENGIQQRVQAIQMQEKELKDEIEKREELSEAALKANRRYGEVYERFVAGQAGLLAEDLRKRVERDGEAACPVCGSSICRDRLHVLELPDADTPDKTKVDRAKEAFERQEEARSAQDKKVERLESALDSDRKHLVTDAGKWLPEGPTWERLCDAYYLDAAIAEARLECAQAEEEQHKRKAEQERRDSEALKLSGLKAGLGACDENIGTQGNKAQAMELKAGKLQEKIDGYKRQLTYPDRAKADAAKADMQRESNALQAQIDRHQKALRDAGDALNSSIGRRSELENTLTEQQIKRDQAKADMSAALNETSFPDAAAVREALIPMGDMEAEAWLKAEHKAQIDYGNDRENTRKDIEDLRAQTEGKQFIDLGALDEAIQQAQNAWDEKNDGLTVQTGLLNNHRDVANQVKTLKQSLERTQVAWERIDRLAGMARGTSGDGGKRSFERYVLSATFLDILEMANRRLNQMSGGRYELMLKDGAKRANAQSGLDIDVMDYSTDQRRSSESLSGGESFFTSLALALGLSDVVQNRAGGRQLDALFIDEGFGTLSDGYLDKALEVLNQLTEGDRLVGIISHVDKLNESIPQKILVTNTGSGSTVKMIQ